MTDPRHPFAPYGVAFPVPAHEVAAVEEAIRAYRAAQTPDYPEPLEEATMPNLVENTLFVPASAEGFETFMREAGCSPGLIRDFLGRRNGT